MKNFKFLSMAFIASIGIMGLTNCKTEDPVYELNGQVTDGEVNQPISGVEVKIVSEKSGATFVKTTNDNGNYAFTDLADGVYAISFTKADYSDASETITLEGKSNAYTVNKTLSFTKALGLRGKVTNSKNSKAVSGLAVKIKNTSSSATTNSAGEYSFADVRRGEYTLSFEKTGYKSIEKTVTVTADDSKNTLDAAVEPTIADLTGRVTDDDTGSPVNGVAVRIKGTTSSATTNSSGEYTFIDLNIGESYTLVFDKSVYELTEKTVTIGADDNRLNVALIPAATRLAGRVTTSSGAAVVGAVVRLSPAASPSSVTTGSDGRYTFTGLKQSSYTISATATGYYDYSSNVTVVNREYENTFNFSMSPSTSTVRVTPSLSLAIETEIRMTFAYSSASNTSRWYYVIYPKSSLPSDASITTTLLSRTPVTSGSTAIYFQGGMSAGTTYVFCTMAVDKTTGAYGPIVKTEFTTKSSSAAKANVSVSSITSYRLYASFSMNSACRSYIILLANKFDINDTWDIELAYDAWQTTTSSKLSDISGGGYLDHDLARGNMVLYTLGYATASGTSPGTLSRVWFSTISNSVIKNTPVMLSAPAEIRAKEDMQSSEVRSSGVPLMLRITDFKNK